MSRTLSVDLNSDMGEGFGTWKKGDDAAILKIVSSANVACGLHAGDPEIMVETFRMAKENGVAIGAHPGFPDLWGFGRRPMPYTPGEIERLVAYQIGAAQALASYAGHEITYVKPHGALGNMAGADRKIGDAVTRAILGVDRSLVSLSIAMGAQDVSAREAGLTVASEIFADRAYTEEGLLVSRSEPGAVIHDAEAAAARAVRMVRNGAIETVSGQRLETPIDSICVHSDTPTAVAIAAGVREGLEAAGIAVKSFIEGARA
ncbi:LamB/YcsF family protein [Pelagovum pacificum]|uniref:5-oxoprolinase subunit A n=1 Tax=Pelagovum pacificum TaxID=2588711 RepID=A0A5C5G7G9_9RHOB|nr:5-oxoprolinase subunit PxpA [Pelagovum pacificum]QQA41906.1 LamB/YcsF family protein [Pelagovum pacificum]TNY30654.1 LamB/YcsF family protein [Pelagovum pacificum]